MHLLNLLRAQARGLRLTAEEVAELGRFERLSQAEREAELRAWVAVSVAGADLGDYPGPSSGSRAA